MANPTNPPLPLYYTFGNHMHWVDMEWLWGYHVLPGSVRDMLAFCRATGAKGNVNFDGIGYEKLAVEAPDALADLRAAIAGGTIEVVGASYGQPYGLFHGGESNVRQRIYGVRTALRLLGTRPRTFWEEEFDFFPQLPQLLGGVGMRYASLYFQWTWHTPEVPWEPIPAVWWEGQDGTRLLTATRNKLNLHQWPEDFAALLAGSTPREMPVPGIVQWLELMPSPDWMCRSELMLPQLHALLADPSFEVRFATLSEYLEAARPVAEVRRYTLADVFHGMSLGKNGDLFRRLSRAGEQALLGAESLSALLGLFGRPYAQWDVYPVWELEEAWRELLSAQHHDNDECEGLCGHVGLRSYERSRALTADVYDRSLRLLARRAGGPAGRVLLYNPLGWVRTAPVTHPLTGEVRLAPALPPMGYTVAADFAQLPPLPPVAVEEGAPGAVPGAAPSAAASITLRRGDLSVTVDRASGLIVQIGSPHFPGGALAPGSPLGTLRMARAGQEEIFAAAEVTVVPSPAGGSGSGQPALHIRRRTAGGAEIRILVQLAPELDAVDVRYVGEGLPRTDSRLHGSLHTDLGAALSDYALIHDHPYAVSAIAPRGDYWRKYPTGDWMTSPQVYEQVHRPFTALQLLDLVAVAGPASGAGDAPGSHGLLFLHDGSQAFWREDNGVVKQVLTMYDAWDEDCYVDRIDVRMRVVPHGPFTHAERWKLAQEFVRPVAAAVGEGAGGELPATFAGLWCAAPNVAVTALYRETPEWGASLGDYAAAGIAYPYVVRLVEWNGQAGPVEVAFPGEIYAAWRTNLLGEVVAPLVPTPIPAPLGGPLDWHAVTVDLRPYEVCTLYLDLVQGRKQTRDLDSRRSVWATAHWVSKVG